MAHKTLIGGTAYEIKGGKCLVNGTAYDVKKGRTLVNGTGYDVSFSNGAPVSDLAVGNSVYMNVNGVKTEFLVVHKGLPSSIYDSSCDGVWLLMKNIYEKQKWHDSNVNDYGSSKIHTYLNGTFLNVFEDGVLSLIKTVKIPYSTGPYSVHNGSDGLSTKAFLLTCREVGYNGAYASFDGSLLSYFDSTTSESSKRIAYLGGVAAKWHLRGVHNTGTSNHYVVNESGGVVNYTPIYSLGVRPTVILPHDALYDPETIMILA